MKKIFFLILLFGLLVPARTGLAQVPEAKIRTARLFLEYFSGGKTAECMALLSADVRDKISAAQLDQLWKSIEFQLGALKSTGAIRTELHEAYEFVYIPCHFSNTSVDLRVVFPVDGEGISGFFFTPPAVSSKYEKPSYALAVETREIETAVVTDTFRLPATLLLPPGDGPFPLVIMVHGSGPNDRDETIGPNKPFADLAYGLAAKGIASLRYDKRTRVYGTQLDPATLTLREETIEDALSAIDSFRNREKIDPERIFILGHSLGAYAAPLIGSLAEEKLAGMILMAGNARPLEQLLYDQYRYLYGLDSLSENERQNLARLKEQVDRAASRKLDPATPPEDLPLHIPAAYWLDLQKYNPVRTARKLDLPMLILQGGRDYQVPESEYALWQQGLEGKKQVAFHLFSKLNHLFLEGNGPSVPDEYLIPGHVPEEVIDVIADWIQ